MEQNRIRDVYIIEQPINSNRSKCFTMRTIRVSVLIALLLTFVSSFAVAQETDSEVALTLSRTPCFGTCPVYTVTIYTDGTVVYEGENFVDITGTQSYEIDPEIVQQLVDGFADAGYFEWNDEYTEMLVSDMPSVITSVTRDGETKQITRYGGDSSAPLMLAYLETWLDLMVNTAQWTGVSPQPAHFTPDMTPVITLERGACFGFCPVYNLVIYDNGTVIYTGISNVEVVGVRMIEIDTLSVMSLADRMSLTGYFDWQDEYTEQLITDQVTVITSLSWDNNYKRITRYDGDPNAPIGLYRFEQEIDAIVNVSQWVGEQQ